MSLDESASPAMSWSVAALGKIAARKGELALGNSTGNPVGITPETRTRPVQYHYPQPHGFSRQNEPKNVEIGQEMRELWLISMNFTKSAITPSVFVRKLRF